MAASRLPRPNYRNASLLSCLSCYLTPFICREILQTGDATEYATKRHGDYFIRGHALRPGASTSAILSELQLIIDNGSPTAGRQAFLPADPEVMTSGYDLDGNLTSDGRWSYSYDAENRLVQMQTNTAAIPNASKQKLVFAYDYLGRRVQKTLYEGYDGTNYSATPVEDLKFVYQGWNMVAMIDAKASGAPIIANYVWGLDLSGSIQGAGGVGGLLMIQEDGDTFLPAYDAMGNLHALMTVSAATLNGTSYSAGDIVAAYEYDAFGRTIRESGAYAASNPFRFSTKYTDVETGLIYYGHRYYSASLGRFINRDPIEEQGGINLYAFVKNNAVNAWDYLGMDAFMIINGDGAWFEGDGMTFEDMHRQSLDQASRIPGVAPMGSTWAESQAYYDNLNLMMYGSGVPNDPSAPYVVTYHIDKEVTAGTVDGQTVSFSDKDENTATINEITGRWAFSSNVAPTVPASVLGNGALGLYTVVRALDQSVLVDMVTPTNSVTTSTGFVNGITGKLSDHTRLGFDHLGSNDTYTLFNIPTAGFLGDVYNVGLQKLGIDTPASTALAGVLQSVTNSGASVQWVAHSGGGAAFAQAMNYALANGSSGLGGNSVRFDGGANNAIMTDRIARTAGVSTGYYYSHADFVPNVIGTNGNPVSMAISTVVLPTLFVGPPLSPHTKPTPNYTYRQGNVAPSGPPVLATPTF